MEEEKKLQQVIELKESFKSNVIESGEKEENNLFIEKSGNVVSQFIELLQRPPAELSELKKHRIYERSNAELLNLYRSQQPPIDVNTTRPSLSISTHSSFPINSPFIMLQPLNSINSTSQPAPKVTRSTSFKQSLNKLRPRLSGPRLSESSNNINHKLSFESSNSSSSLPGLFRRQSESSSSTRTKRGLQISSPQPIIVQDLRTKQREPRSTLEHIIPSNHKENRVVEGDFSSTSIHNLASDVPQPILRTTRPTLTRAQSSNRRSWRMSFSGQSSTPSFSTLPSPLPPYVQSEKPLPIIQDTSVSLSRKPSLKRNISVTTSKWISAIKLGLGSSSKKDVVIVERDSIIGGKRKKSTSSDGDRLSSEVSDRPSMMKRSQSAPVLLNELVNISSSTTMCDLQNIEESLEPISTIKLKPSPLHSRSHSVLPFPLTTTSTPTPIHSDLNQSTTRRSSIDFVKVDISSTPRTRSTSVASLLSLSRPSLDLYSSDSSTNNLSASPSRIINLNQHSSLNATTRSDIPLLPLRAREISLASNRLSNSNASEETQFMKRSSTTSSLLLDSPLSPSEYNTTHTNQFYFSPSTKQSITNSISTSTLTKERLDYLSNGPQLRYNPTNARSEISNSSSGTPSASHSELGEEEDDVDTDAHSSSKGIESDSNDEPQADLTASEEIELEKRLWRSRYSNSRESSEQSSNGKQEEDSMGRLINVW